MYKNQIYGLTGLAGVGKDTVADLLVTHCSFTKLAFADALRAEIANGFGVDSLYLTRPELKNRPMAAFRMELAPKDFLAHVSLNLIGIPRTEFGTITNAWMMEPRSPRQIMQWWGTEYRRAQERAYWSRTLLDRMVELMRDGHQRFVITDCRFQNEVDTLRSAGGRLWQVTRPGIDAGSTPEGAHVSVTDGSNFEPEFVIHNAHDIAHLQQLVLSEYVSNLTGIRGARVTVPA